MKIFTGAQIRQIDGYTIEYEPINSINLMERASIAIMQAFVSLYSANCPVFIFAGPGNNGGDGIALARHLGLLGYNVKVYILKSENYSPDNLINIQRLGDQGVVYLSYVESPSDFPQISKNGILVDSLFGSGLTRSLSGVAKQLVDYLNDQKADRVAIDIPSGLFTESNPCPNENSVFRADLTITIQFPKLSFFFPENDQYVGKWNVVDIGLHPQAIREISSPYFLVDDEYVLDKFPRRNKFDHKGLRGHCLIIAGSQGMCGAAIISAKSCLMAGAGLVSVHVPQSGLSIVQQALPEAIVVTDTDLHFFTDSNPDKKYNAIAIGPGLGTHKRTIEGFRRFLQKVHCPLVIDADGLNIIAHVPELMELVPQNTIITPHVGEFNRLFGETNSGYGRLALAQEFATKYSIIIILKGAHTQIVCPSGQVYFNSTGNSAMATAGSGDSLTGIIVSLLGQGLKPINAAVLGVYLHGKAADLALDAKGGGSIIAGDISNALSLALGCFNSKFTKKYT